MATDNAANALGPDVQRRTKPSWARRIKDTPPSSEDSENAAEHEDGGGAAAAAAVPEGRSWSALSWNEAPVPAESNWGRSDMSNWGKSDWAWCANTVAVDKKSPGSRYTGLASPAAVDPMDPWDSQPDPWALSRVTSDIDRDVKKNKNILKGDGKFDPALYWSSDRASDDTGRGWHQNFECKFLPKQGEWGYQRGPIPRRNLPEA